MKTKRLWFTKIASLLLLVAFMSNCKDEDIEVLSVCPEVVSTNPANLAEGVPLNPVIVATFNIPMDPETFTEASFTIQEEAKILKTKPTKQFSATPIAGTINYSDLSATFTPAQNLNPESAYTATISWTVKDLQGNNLKTDYVWTFSTGTHVLPYGPGVVDLGTAGDFAILTKSGISTINNTLITGHIGVSPATSTAITGFSETMDASGEFSTSIYVVGNIYAADYAPPTPTYVSTAISDQENAFTTAMGLTTDVISDLGAGDISGMTLAPGLYKWGTGLLITNQGVTLSGSSNDTWVFQIADDFTIENDASITLTGGALPENIFWITSAQALLGSNVEFYGNLLAQTLISLTNGTTVNGRLLSQTAVTLDESTVTKPTSK